MEKQLQEIIDDIILGRKPFSVYAKMYLNDERQAREFVKMVYAQSHSQYLRESYGPDLMKKIEDYCSDASYSE